MFEHVVLVRGYERLRVFMPILCDAERATTDGSRVVSVGCAYVVHTSEAVGCADREKVRLGGPA